MNRISKLTQPRFHLLNLGQILDKLFQNRDTVHVEGRKYKTEEVIRLYVEEKKSVSELAKKFGVCDATIYKCLKRNGVYTKRTRWDYEK